MIVRTFTSAATSFLRPSRMPVFPLSINYEPNSTCNLNCVMCDRAGFFKNDHRITASTFAAWYDQTRPAYIALHGYGEPLLNTDLFTMIRYAKDHGSRTTITSNLVLLGDRAEQLVSCGIDLIKVSLDATDQNTYQKVRRTDAFDTVIGNIRSLVAVKKRLSATSPEIRINFTISSFNVHQIAPMVIMAKELGVPSICYAVLLFKDSMLNNRDCIGDLSKDEFLQGIEEGIRVAHETGCVTNLQSIRRDFAYHWYAYDKKDPQARRCRRRCLKPWLTTFISSNGDVKPCDLLGLTDVVMGNLNEQRFASIWNGIRYRDFRKAIRTGDRPHRVCQDCFPMGWGDFFEYRTISKRYLME
jgi:radical SAM protein with 4Fe4S-binding SPASM domain